MIGFIEIPKDKLLDAVRGAYALSRPVGMGMLHFREGDLDDATAQRIVEMPGGPNMDYVHGRQCKFRVKQEGDRFFIAPRWYGHTHTQLVALLAKIDLAESAIAAALGDGV